MPDKVYLEITNVCNLACAFCHGTKREKRSVTREEFELLTDRLRGIPYLYFHLMGEPLTHPDLPYFVGRAREKGFFPMITTNGTLLGARGRELIHARPHKVSISLHAIEGNGKAPSDGYMRSVIGFADEASAAGIITVLRLWNDGGAEKENPAILRALETAFPAPWQDHRSGKKIKEKLFLETGEKFDWPDAEKEGEREVLSLKQMSLKGTETEENAPTRVFCYGLRDQIGVLADGTVVPCCLDAEGEIALGNLFNSTLAEIVNSPRARAMYDGFTEHRAVEPLCRTCGYAKLKEYRKK